MEHVKFSSMIVTSYCSLTNKIIIIFLCQAHVAYPENPGGTQEIVGSMNMGLTWLLISAAFV